MANNVNNGITGVIDIPGALRSRGAADGNLVGGVVAYAGDIYDTTAGKNQAAINEEFDAKLQQTELCIDISDYIRIQGGANEWIHISGNYLDGYYITEEDQNKGSALASLLSDCDLLDTTTLEKVAKIRYANYVSNTLKLELTLDTDLGELDGDGFCIENINAVQNSWSFGIGYFGNSGMYSSLVGFRNYNTGSMSCLLGYDNLNTKSRSSIVGTNNDNAKQNSVVLGDSNTNNGTYSNITGCGNQNSAAAASVMGYQNNVTADSSLAYTSVIGGLNTVNSGGVILGIQNTTNCVGSTYILGRQNTVSVPNTSVDTTVLLGQHLSVTNNGGGLYIGRYNKEYAGPSLDLMNYFAIGGGSSDLTRRNLLEIKRNGEVFISDIGGFDGTNSTVTGIKSLQDILSDLENSSSSSSSSYITYSEGEGYSLGDTATASGKNSFAEGDRTTASGVTSHAEGNSTTASGQGSHAEGGFSTASGDYSHAEGDSNTASGLGSHAEGGGTTASAEGAHAEGVETSAIGDYAHAEGYQTHANEIGAHAEGNGTTAFGEYSHAEGNGTYAIGYYSHAEGAAEYVNNHLSSDYTAGSQTMNLGFIADVGNIIIVDNQIAKILSVTGNSSHYTVSLDKSFASDISESTTIKIYPCASGTYSHTEGFNNMASGESSHAEGYNTKAQGTASHTEGSGTKALGLESHAEGYNTYADGNYSHAEGTDTQASGTYSHAEGFNSRATGASSHAEGANTYASGTRSHAEGYMSNAMGDYTHAEGFNTLARNTGEHACGTYNKSTQNVTLFSIGNGYTGQNGAPDIHQNAFEVDVNGNVYIKGIGNYNGMNIGQSGVESVQEVITELTLQIAALTNNL